MNDRLGHHDLCFGCGLANVFGLHLELERAPGGDGVTGRFFVKQDHQGEPGVAHPGVVAAALEEALALASGEHPRRLVVEHAGTAPVGTFVAITAAGGLARATGEHGLVATANVPQSSPGASG
jgi:acyl-coenzyme A thioesterase PaaI-like protein